MSDVKAKETKGSFFTRAYKGGEEFGLGIKCKVAETKLKESFNSQYTNLVSNILDKASDLNDLRNDVVNYKLSTVLKAKADIVDIINTANMVSEEFKFLFDKDLKSDISIKETLLEILDEALVNSLLAK